MKALIDAIKLAFGQSSEAATAEAAVLRRALALLNELSATPRLLPPQTLPVCRHFDSALAAAATVPGPTASIAQALRPLALSLHWVQNPNYINHPDLAQFIQRYGYTEFVGLRGVYPSTDMLLGVLLLAPHTLYPSHNHPAEEIYLVLAGHGRWQRGTAGWQTRPPGSLIHHPPNLSHATQATADPLMALYLWVDNIAQHAALT